MEKAMDLVAWRTAVALIMSIQRPQAPAPRSNENPDAASVLG